MKLTASVVPYSSVVGSSIKMCDETGKVVALLIVSIPNPEFEYKATAKIVTDDVLWRLAKRPVAFRVKDARGDWDYFDDEATAIDAADRRDEDYQGVYVRDGS